MVASTVDGDEGGYSDFQKRCISDPVAGCQIRMREKETDSSFSGANTTRGLAAVGKITWGKGGGGFMDLTRRSLPSRAVASGPFWVLPWLCEGG